MSKGAFIDILWLPIRTNKVSTVDVIYMLGGQSLSLPQTLVRLRYFFRFSRYGFPYHDFILDTTT